MRKGKDLSPSAPNASCFGESPRGKSPLDGSFVDQVRQRAYELYEKRVSDNHAGDPMSDWLAAEEQVRLELSRENGVMA